jgi:hypothetical protein
MGSWDGISETGRLHTNEISFITKPSGLGGEGGTNEFNAEKQEKEGSGNILSIILWEIAKFLQVLIC